LSQPGHALRFIGQWLANPLQTGAILPSGRDLAALMVRDIIPGQGRVIEFGGGTGVFTRALLDKGVPPDMLDVVEINPGFAAALRIQFPEVRIIMASAADLDEQAIARPGGYAAIVSGLPFLSLPKAVRVGVIAQASRLLAADGAMMQFSYAPRCPVPPALLRAHRLVATRIGSCARNIPPAHVFRICRA
jgi:phospholipid N-methyltransferase